MAERKTPRAKSAPSTKTAAKPATKKAPAKAAPAKAAPAKAAPAKKAAEPATKKAPSKNVPATRASASGAKRAPAKKAPAAKAVAKAAPKAVAAPKKAPAKTAAASVAKAVKASAPKRAPRKRPELTGDAATAAEHRRQGARDLALAIAASALDRKAERIEIIDLGDKVDYADFLVVMSGRSDRQVRAIADGLTEAVREKGHRPSSVEGMQQGQWVLVDFTDVIAHVFVEEARQHYDIEGLWMDATRVPFDATSRPAEA